jgi:hypothetical protein
MRVGAPELLILIILLGSLAVMILYLVSLQSLLKEVSIENRKMPPGNVWLILIPFFGMVWQFIVINRIADSVKAEFQKRNISSDEERPGFAVGLTYCILFCCSIIPYLGALTSLVGMVFWIVYWVKVSGFKNLLAYSPALDSPSAYNRSNPSSSDK